MLNIDISTDCPSPDDEKYWGWVGACMSSMDRSIDIESSSSSGSFGVVNIGSSSSGSFGVVNIGSPPSGSFGVGIPPPHIPPPQANLLARLLKKYFDSP
jgi:hypothetical protein